MACLWRQEDDGSWVYEELTSPCVDLAGSPAEAEPASPTAPPVLAQRSAGWVLLAGGVETSGPGVTVNGDRVVGLRILDHRDEIRIGGDGPRYFTTEQPARIVPYVQTGEARIVKCARCRAAIDHHAPSVTCPACGAVHHESGDQPCWTYEAKCASCREQATALDAGFRWTPEGL